MRKAKNLKPIVWNAENVKTLSKRKITKGKLTFFSIENPEGDLDFLLSGKMLRARYQSAKLLHKKAKKHYKKTKKRLSEVGLRPTKPKQIARLEKKLVTAKLIQNQTKEFRKMAKADLKDFRKFLLQS